MEAQSALIRPDGAVELNTEAAVHLHLAVIVYPGHSEHNLPFRLDQPFQQGLLPDIWGCVL